MTDEIVFYTNPMSRGRIVRWVLEELGQPYRAEILDFSTTMKAPGYLAINPMGKVPAIRHGDAVVTEAAAICAYLADTFPQAGLGPSTAAARAAYYRWMFFAAGPLEAATTNSALGFAAPAERERMLGYGTLAHVLDTLEGALRDTAHIAGERFTAADVYVGSQLGWGMMVGSIAPRPAFTAYWQRLAARPAAIRAKEIDDALMATGGSGKPG